jgi:hypothetical protein
MRLDVEVKPYRALGGRTHLWTVVNITDACDQILKFFATKTKTRGITMPKFVIEREISEEGRLSSGQLQAISQKSCGVLREMGAQIQWVLSYVTDDKIYCIYVAPDENAVRKHAQLGGFPANRISRIRSVIDPTTAE